MALSTTEIIVEAGQVGETDFDLTFEGGVDNAPGYLAKTHIFLWIDDIQQTMGGGAEYDGSGVSFTWLTTTRVSISGYSAILDDKIEFRRTMPTDTPYVDFVDRAGITEKMLDESNLSNLYAIHEIKDGFGTGTQNYYELAKLYATAPEDYEVETGTYSAYHWSQKSEELGAAQVALCQAEVDLCEAQVVLATAEKDEAALWAAKAEDVEVTPGYYSSFHYSQKADELGAAQVALAQAEVVNCQTELANCQAEVDLCEAQTALANTARTGAETAETGAEAAETAAAGDAADALSHKNKAQDWAEEAEDVEVESGKYSSYHWAQKSQDLAEGSHTHDTRYFTETESDGRFSRLATESAHTRQQIYTRLTKTGTSVTLNCLTDGLATISLTGNTTFQAPTNKAMGRHGTLIITQGANRTISFNANWVFSWGDAPIMPATSGDVMVITWITDGSQIFASIFMEED